MAGLVFGCIAPHGGIIIPELAGDMAATTAPLREAMEELGRRMQEARPETVVVITPHGVRVAGVICVMTTERAYGELGGEAGEGHIEVDMAVDTELGRRIAEQAAYVYSVPVATAIYGASGGEGCSTPLDWGAVVPLWYLGARWPNPPRLISMTPSRELTLQQLYDCGTALAEAAEESGKRVALVASCDWGHAHAADGPYGYDPASARFDKMVQDTIRRGDLDSLLHTDLEFADQAKVDGLWQSVMLAGALHHTPMKGELLAYQAPTYFGMLVAAYEPEKNS